MFGLSPPGSVLTVASHFGFPHFTAGGGLFRLRSRFETTPGSYRRMRPARRGVTCKALTRRLREHKIGPGMSAFEAVKNVVLTLCAITGTVFAVRGLNTWHRQLLGTADFDLARRLLRALYEWRDTIELTRLPVIWAEEMTPDPGKDTEAKDKEHQAGQKRAYERRWARVMKARTEIQVLSLEAEVLWGDGIKSDLRALNAIQGELVDAIGEHLRRQAATLPIPPAERAREIERSIARDRILYSWSADDEFSGAVGRALIPLEDRLRPHLRGGKR